MDQAGLWRLFFLTGLPEAWLAVREGHREQDAPEREPAIPAHAPGPEDSRV